VFSFYGIGKIKTVRKNSFMSNHSVTIPDGSTIFVSRFVVQFILYAYGGIG